MTKALELRELNEQDLRNRERDLDDQLFRLRIQKSMGQLEAAHKLGVKWVVPMHYDTFPIIHADPKEFAKKVTGSQVLILKPGESVEF